MVLMHKWSSPSHVGRNMDLSLSEDLFRIQTLSDFTIKYIHVVWPTPPSIVGRDIGGLLLRP